MASSWTYKVFYFTVLSFVFITFLASFSTIVKTAFYQGFSLEDSSLSIFGISANNSGNKDKAVAKQYVDATIPLVFSTVVAVVFVYFLKPKHLEKQA